MNIGSILKVIGHGALKGAEVGDNLHLGGIAGLVIKGIVVAGEAVGKTGPEKRVMARDIVAKAYPEANPHKLELVITLLVEALKLLETAEVRSE